MGKSIRVITKKRRGRPVTTGKGTLIGVRLLDGPLALLDDWIAKQKEVGLTRPEAIRRLVELGLTVKARGRSPTEGQKLRAREMASKAIDQMTDATAARRSGRPQASAAQRARRIPTSPRGSAKEVT